jgi:prepilin-type processing-associated H-X9-DG protein
MPTGWPQPLWKQLVAIAIIVIFLAYLLRPVSYHHGERAVDAGCLSNLKQVALGAALYCAESDDRLPLRDRWMDDLGPYVKDKTLYVCPIVRKEEREGYGYSYNSYLHGRAASKVNDAAKVPILYDSINYARNASDPLNSFPKPGRHKGRNTVAFVDTHAKRVTPDP